MRGESMEVEEKEGGSPWRIERTFFNAPYVSLKCSVKVEVKASSSNEYYASHGHSHLFPLFHFTVIAVKHTE